MEKSNVNGDRRFDCFRRFPTNFPPPPPRRRRRRGRGRRLRRPLVLATTAALP